MLGRRLAILSCLLFFRWTIECVVGASTGKNVKNKELGNKGNPLSSVKGNGGKTLEFPYYVSGYDYEDRPIIVFEWGKWDIRSLVENSNTEELARVEKKWDDMIELAGKGFFNKKGYNSESGGVEIVGLIDFDGVDVRQLGTPASMGFFVRNLAKLERIYNEVSYAFLVNANPVVNHAIQATKPFMGKFLERSEIYGTNSKRWIPHLLKKIPRSELHPAYGGTKDFLPVAVYNLL